MPCGLYSKMFISYINKLLFTLVVKIDHAVNRTWWLSGCRSRFVLRRSRVQISAQRPAILTKVFVVFLSPYM
jgi:hypothetical protein